MKDKILNTIAHWTAPVLLAAIAVFIMLLIVSSIMPTMAQYQSFAEYIIQLRR